jgi:hypothetical protein
MMLTQSYVASAGRGLLDIPARRVFFAAAALWLVLHTVALDRNGLIDHANYLAYFETASELALSEVLPDIGEGPLAIAVWLVEEPLWRLITILLSRVLDPEAAVIAVASAIQVLMVAATQKYRRPLLALSLWILLPVGYAVIGTYQLRQGLAFAVWIFMLSRHSNRPLAAAVLAGLIHTTFLILVPISLVVARKELPPLFRLLGIFALSVALMLIGDMIFESFGGRRALQYTGLEHEFTLNYAVGLLILSTYPAVVLFARAQGLGSRFLPLGSQHTYVCTYLGLLLYLLVAWALLPLAGYRINYMAWLGLIPLLCNGPIVPPGLPGRQRQMLLLSLSLLSLLVGYTVVKAALEQRYLCMLTPECSVVLE